MTTQLASKRCINIRQWLISHSLLSLVCFLLLHTAAYAGNNTTEYADLSTVLTQQGEVRAGVKGSFNTTGYTLSLAFDGQPTFHPEREASSASYDGVSHYVYCLASDGIGNLYVGGIFDHAEGIVANAIAKWNGKTWSALGKGLTLQGRASGGVVALVLDKKGNLYAGGGFSQAGEIEAKNIAKWDGTSWSALGSGRPGNVHALAIDKNDILYAGGLSAKGGDFISGGAKWDGSAWSPIGYLGLCHIRALVFDKNNNLYAGFNSIPTMGANFVGKGRFGYVGKWDGLKWEPVGPGEPTDGCRTIALDSAGNLYAGGGSGGLMKEASGRPANIAKWNKESWSLFSSDVGYGRIDAIAVSGKGEIYIGGQLEKANGATVNALAKWNGQSWVALDPPLTAHVICILFDKADNMYVGGSFYRKQNGGGPGNFIAKWDGKKWSPLETTTIRSPSPPYKASSTKPKTK